MAGMIIGSIAGQAPYSRPVESGDVIAQAHRNYVGSYRKLAEHLPGGEVRESGSLVAFVTGLRMALFNGCVIIGPVPADAVRDALGWVNGHGLPLQVAIVEELLPGLEEVLGASGLLRTATWPGMILDPVPPPPAPAPAVSVEPGVRGGLLNYLPPSMLDDPEVAVFTALLEGRAAGTALAIRTGEVAGVYGVGTLPDARRRGVGTAATWAAIAAGRDWGCAPIVLQATEMGVPMYEGMGFRTVVRYAIFRAPPRA